jgi:hypothetical protein
MPYIYPRSTLLDKTAKVDGGECARLAQHFIPQIGHTSIWKPGARVMDVLASGGKIERGTAIATFVNGRYPTHGKRHAAFFEYELNSCTYDPKLKQCSIIGIVMTDQWNSEPDSKNPRVRITTRTVRPYGMNSPWPISDNANMFYIIEH